MPTAYRYTGQRWDTWSGTVGLYFYNARYYDASLGRFVQPDTIVPGAGNSQALNRYSYVFNNPLRLIDPSGRWPCADGVCQESGRDRARRIKLDPSYDEARLYLASMVYAEQGGAAGYQVAAAYVAWNSAGRDMGRVRGEVESGRYQGFQEVGQLRSDNALEKAAYDHIYNDVAPGVLTGAIPDPTSGALFFANIARGQRETYEETLAYRVGADQGMWQGQALAAAGYGFIDSPRLESVFVLNKRDSVPLAGVPGRVATPQKLPPLQVQPVQARQRSAL